MDNGDPVRESRGRSTSAGKKGRSKKLFGRAPERHTNVDRHASKTVRKMPYTDQFGDFGFYTGQVDDVSRPHGKGSMKYDNGGKFVFLNPLKVCYQVMKKLCVWFVYFSFL